VSTADTITEAFANARPSWVTAGIYQSAFLTTSDGAARDGHTQSRQP
jgi:hypothetical protein